MFTPRYLKLLILSQGPTDHKRSVGLLLSLPEVHDHSLVLLTFRERQLSWHHDVSLSTSSKYAASSSLLMRPRTTVSLSKFNDRSGAVRGHAVMGVRE